MNKITQLRNQLRRAEAALRSADFDSQLEALLDAENAVLSIPGMYEILAEDLNNAAMDLMTSAGLSFEDALDEIVGAMSGAELLATPGVYEVAVDYFNPDPDDTDDELDEEPQENDAFISNARGGGYDLSVEGEFLGEFDDRDEAAEFLRAWAQKHNYYPTLWFVDDHGGHVVLGY